MNTLTSIDHRVKLLRKQNCFNGLNEDEINMLADLLEEKTYPAGSKIVMQGAPVDSVFLIVSGTADVQVTHHQMSGNSVETIATLSTGQAIGLSDTGFYSLSGIRTATVVAKTDLVLLYLSVALFHGFALANTHVSEVMRNFTGSYMSDMSDTPKDNF